MPDALEYQRRTPKTTVLYRVVQQNLETFLACAREHGRVVPRFVERELRAFLDCGLVCRGFLRVRCKACGDDRLVAFLVLSGAEDYPESPGGGWRTGTARVEFRPSRVLKAAELLQIVSSLGQ